ncbi:ATP-grasp domain-containing protein [Spirosoma arcticum]
MKHLAFVTYAGQPGIAPDDALVAAALRQHQIAVTPAVWNDVTVDWTGFDGVVVRSCWDYHRHAERFQSWLSRLAEESVRVYNPVAQLVWNMDKRYLRDFASVGIAIPPTIWLTGTDGPSLQEVIEQTNWSAIVMKPAVSGGAYQTYAFNRAEVAQFEPISQTLRQQTTVLVQPLLPQVLADGEWSLLFFNGCYSHAVLKRAAPAEFRVQTQWGGTVQAGTPPANYITQATAVLAQVTPVPLYARVDGVGINGQFVLMELELIEPVLFLSHSDGAVERFTNQIMEVVA